MNQYYRIYCPGNVPASEFTKEWPNFDEEIGFEEFHYIWKNVRHLAPIWKSVAEYLPLDNFTIYEIERDFPNDNEKRLRRSLTHWLARDYSYEDFGVPTFQMLYDCLIHKRGGNDPVAAAKLAKERSGRSPFTVPSHLRGYFPPQYRTWCLEWTSHERRHRSTFYKRLRHVQDTAPYVKRTLHSVRDHHVLGLVQRCHKLELQFAEAVYETRDAIPLSLLSEMKDYANFHLVTILSPAHTKRSRIESMRTWIACSYSVSFFIMNITKYMSWFNYGLLFRLVKVYLSHNKRLVQRWCRYREDMKEFFASDNNFAVQYGDAIEFGLSKSITSKIMVLKVVHDDYTLNDLFFFHEAIPKALRVGDYHFYLCRVDRGCLKLTYSVPDFVYSLIFPLTSEQRFSLAKIGVFRLTCGDYDYEIDILPLHETRVTSHEEDICIYDPLWYENTHTPLHESCWKGITEEVEWFLNDKFGQQMLSENLNGWTPPLSAAYGGHMDILRLLNNHYDMSQGDNDGVTSLHMASYKGHLNIVEYLLNECHTDPDRADSSGNTALLYSALGGHVDLVTLFIEKRCNVSQCNKEGATLSLLACKSGQVALVSTLQALDLFSFETRDYIGRGIVHYSCMSHGNSEILQYIITNIGLVSILNDRDHYRRTPLHIACQYASSSLITTIIDYHQVGYDLLLDVDYFKWSSLHYLVCALVKCINNTTVFNKLIIPSDLRFLLQFEKGEAEYGDYITLNYNTSKLHDRVSLFSTLLRQVSLCSSNFDIVNATTTTGQSLMDLAQTSGSVLLVNVLKDSMLNCHDNNFQTAMY